MAGYIIKTLGCKVNQFETDAIGLALEKNGWKKASKDEKADLCIINTCTVTGKASVQSRQAVKSVIRKNPGAKIIVTGCYAQTEASEIEKIVGVHSIISHSEKHKIPDMIVSKSGMPSISSDCNSSCQAEEFESIDIDVYSSRTRPFLKIQDGCNAFCTYCIVPHSRGRNRSMAADEVLQRLKNLSEKGFHEIVLTGIHIGQWGTDLEPGYSFADLLKRIEREKPVSRIRMSSIEPFEIDDDIINMVASSDIFCDHFHIPLQSGDDNILKRMHRPYTADFFRRLVKKIHTACPGVSIGADILTGFPGESEAEFLNTFNLIEELPVSYLHVFPFSPRKGTPAATYDDQLPETIKKDRTAHLKALGESKNASFLKSMPGKEAIVLIENERDKKTGNLKGLTSNYVTVQIKGTDKLKNTLTRVLIEEVKGNILSGVPVKD